MIFSKHFLYIILLSTSMYASNKEEQLGQMLFFDPILSKNKTQSCSTCHNPEHGFIDNRDNNINAMVSLGDDGKSLGTRNAPSIAYASYIPHFHWNKKTKQFIGGQFLDGRALNLTEQAGGPPLNPIEMGITSKEELVKRLRLDTKYLQLFEEVYGKGILDKADNGYQAMSKAIASFEKTSNFSPFDSKYDKYLEGEYEMSALEEQGMNLFFSDTTNCTTCHSLVGPYRLEETFSNYEYHNIGVPKNTTLFDKKIVKKGFIDYGLSANLKATKEEHKGKFKVPTLRNIAITAPYMHNGVFKDLRTVIEFYDSYNNPNRTINKETNKPWGKPEVSHNINIEELKANKLKNQEIEALIAFLKTLTDKRYERLIK